MGELGSTPRNLPHTCRKLVYPSRSHVQARAWTSCLFNELSHEALKIASPARVEDATSGTSVVFLKLPSGPPDRACLDCPSETQSACSRYREQVVGVSFERVAIAYHIMFQGSRHRNDQNVEGDREMLPSNRRPAQGFNKINPNIEFRSALSCTHFITLMLRLRGLHLHEMH
ncbi:MAG: hypothetical protein JO335_03715 [Sphingomonas sp.]|nr:hypothetical protein [Sphingomonas sp.]